ncbi:MAG: hypothetical protein QM741_13295 [Rudaea sp.]|uniref:hypothetical protein n=1 Tax=Rudaea sp. TaxID=2136325 RepID=UPI0039E22A92
MNECFVGIDVSKAGLDVYVSSTHSMREYVNEESGIAALVAELVDCVPKSIVLEATEV